LPGIGAGGIRRGTKPISRCRGTSEVPFGATTGPRLKHASGPLHGQSAWKADGISFFTAEPERWNGIRTRVSMINSHVLYH
jgi:hypothetical protein